MHIEKGLLGASVSNLLYFMSMEANVTVWRFLMSSLAEIICRGLKNVVYFHKNINHAHIQKFTVITLHESPKLLKLIQNFDNFWLPKIS